MHNFTICFGDFEFFYCEFSPKLCFEAFFGMSLGILIFLRQQANAIIPVSPISPNHLFSRTFYTDFYIRHYFMGSSALCTNIIPHKIINLTKKEKHSSVFHHLFSFLHTTITNFILSTKKSLYSLCKIAKNKTNFY